MGEIRLRLGVWLGAGIVISEGALQVSVFNTIGEVKKKC